MKEATQSAVSHDEAPGIQLASGSPWRVAAAAVSGESHQRAGTPCQDAIGLQALENGLLLAVVADGAGSAVYAEEGAHIAASVALKNLAAALADAQPEDSAGWKMVIEDAFAQARLALACVADQLAAPLADFAATLTCAVAAPGWLAWGHLGDGALVCGPSADALLTITRPQRGEYANETCFLSQENALERVEVRVLDFHINALALMSDGLLRLGFSLPSLTPHLPFFKPLFDFTQTAENPEAAGEQLAAFLASERANARTDDDKSLILAVRQPPSPGEAQP